MLEDSVVVGEGVNSRIKGNETREENNYCHQRAKE